MNTQTEITGRDDYIIAQALWEARKLLDSLPDKERPDSNIKDMRAILETRYSGLQEMFAFQDDLRRALRLGMQMEIGQSYDPEDVKAFLNRVKPKEV